MEILAILLSLILASTLPAMTQSSEGDSYLTWTAKQALAIGKSMRASGRVSGTGRGLLNTNKSSSYKIRATWLTPEVIRATARLTQINNRLTDEETRALVRRAEESDDLIFMIEIDPNEGSGVIPSGWQAFLQRKGLTRGQGGAIKGSINSSLGKNKVFNGVEPRNYDYDLFWATFPIRNQGGGPALDTAVQEVELVVRIEEKEGKIRFPMPDSIRRRLNELGPSTQ